MSTIEDTAISSYRDVGLYWREQLDHSHEIFKPWETRAQKIVSRYRDERPIGGELNSRFNILWSNVQVLKPSLYGRQAKPEVSRRYMDADPVGRCASIMLERVMDYEIQQFPDFNDSMNAVVEDRLLPGRGIVWIRFDAFDTNGDPLSAQISSEEESDVEIAEAHAPVDYVYWKDFRHSPARTWDEVWWVARAVYLTRDEGVERFGDIFRNVPLSEYTEDNSKATTDKAANTALAEKAKVWEIWNKRTGKVCWLADSYAEALDERDDPLGLEEFFPCPKPLWATTTNGSLIPVPDFTEYQDQAAELDSITARIDHLVDAVRAAGVYNGEFKELSRLLKSKGNVLVPVTNWGAFSEKGGMKGAIELVDLSTISQALGVLYKARDTVIQTIYEVSGISDVQRGSTKAEETLGAQQLKVNFGSLRLRTSQQEVARFASDIFKLKAQVICKFYPAPLIVQMSGILGTDEGQDQNLVMQAVQLLADSPIRDFHIAIESDSLAQIDDEAEKAAATEAVVAIGKFMAEWLPAVAQMPQIIPMVSGMLLYLVRRYRAGRELESVIEQSMQQLKAAAEAPKGPSPEQVEAQMQQQADQARIAADTQAAQMKEEFAAQRENQKLASEAQLEQMKAQLDQQKAEYEAQIEAATEAQRLEVEKYKIDSDNATKLRLGELQSETQLAIADKANATAVRTSQISKLSGEPGEPDSLTTNSDVGVAIEGAIERLAQHFESSMPPPAVDRTDELAQQIAAIQQMVSQFPSMLAANTPAPSAPPETPRKPSRFKIARDADGRMSELIPVED